MVLSQVPLTAFAAVVAAMVLCFLDFEPLSMGKVIDWCAFLLGPALLGIGLGLFGMGATIRLLI